MSNSLDEKTAILPAPNIHAAGYAGDAGADCAAGAGQSGMVVATHFSPRSIHKLMNPTVHKLILALVLLAGIGGVSGLCGVTVVGCNKAEQNESLFHTAKGVDLYREGMYTLAVAKFRLALEAWPENHKANIFLGMIYFHQYGDSVVAEPFLKRAVELQPDNPEYNYHYGSLLAVTGRLDMAAVHLAKTLAVEPGNAAAHLRLGMVYEEKNNPNDAVKSYTAAIENDPRFGAAYAALAGMYIRFDKVDQAEQVLENCIRNAPEHHECHNDLGMILVDRGEYDKAIALFEKALALKVDYTAALFNLGMAWRGKGDHDKAKQYLELYLLKADPKVEQERIDMARRALLGA